ncbi:NEDD8 activating enzyme [Savitreella phatthalungensis]
MADVELQLQDADRKHSARWTYLKRILGRPGPYAEDYDGGDTAFDFVQAAKILVIGAGGLGCEILKNLALSGFTDLHVIDMDTIDTSNLNRQFLFRPADIGKSKAETAAAFVMNRVQGVQVTPFHGRVQDKDEDFYAGFNIVVCGLDNVAARRWMNAMLVGLVDEDNPESLKPMIDGGTEGLKGQSRVILPTISSCYECSLDMLGKAQTYPICTIANTPRLPEHCIEWASVLEWPRVRPDIKLDADEPEHIDWLLSVASERAKTFNITGVTRQLTQGVVKNIIPAVASTNAVIAASCCNEALKIATSSNPYLDNYMMFTGNDSVYTYTFQHERRPDCPVCGNLPTDLACQATWTLQDMIDGILAAPDTPADLQSPSLRTGERNLYLQAPPPLEQATRPNLKKPLKELVSEGEEVAVTSATLRYTLNFRVRYL